MSENLSAMQADLSGLIANWSSHAIISRISSTLTSSGRFSGSYVTKASGTFIIEPYSAKARGSTSERKDYGFKDETTHVIFARYGTDVQAEDRLQVVGDTYWYDVLSVNPTNGVHYELLARQVKKT